MNTATRSASYKGLTPASPKTSRVASASSVKSGTKPELLLRSALRGRGLRYRLNYPSLPGRPDIVFVRARVAIFCDGDFWHGRELESRLRKLAAGHNGFYWTSKICANVERDRRHDLELARAGWLVLRFWESEIRSDTSAAVHVIAEAIHSKLLKSASKMVDS
jgi:DNA mismatch endonuclease (patch repair protein)